MSTNPVIKQQQTVVIYARVSSEEQVQGIFHRGTASRLPPNGQPVAV